LDHEELYNTLLRKGYATPLADLRAASSTPPTKSYYSTTPMDLAGNPNAADVPCIPINGENGPVSLLSDKGLELVAPDPVRVARCEFWQKILYY
jgi:hypothetical protein